MLAFTPWFAGTDFPTPRSRRIPNSARGYAINKLKPDKQEAVIQALVEECSMGSTQRLTGVQRDTIMRLMVQVGENCDAVPVHRVSKRDAASAQAFITDLASRLENRIQPSSDALRSYVDAEEAGVGPDVDYATTAMSYEAEAVGPGRYSPAKVISVNKRRTVGRPDTKMASTACAERQDLRMRMAMRRSTRLRNAHGKKVENLRAAVSPHFAHYNLVRGHRSLSGATAAMAAIANEARNQNNAS